MTIVIAPRALKDISDAHDYIAMDNPRAAERLLERLNEVTQHLATGELSGPQVRLRHGGLVYRWSLPPYRLY